MDLHRPADVTEAEIEVFRAAYAKSHGSVLGAYEFWLENNPRVVKSHRIQAWYSASDEGRALPLHGTLAFLHLYTVMGYEFGINYEVQHSRTLGASKAAVVQAIELAFIHSGPRGADAARIAAKSTLDSWEGTELDMTAAFPPGWARDPSAFDLELDLTTAELAASELAAIRAWYLRVAGEVPPHVDFLAAGRPGLLKAHLDRMFRAMDGPLPNQVLPFVLLQMYVAQGNPAGIRESALLGRGLGMTSDQLYEAAAWGAMYGGPPALSLAAQIAGDVFQSAGEG
ncbi:hypothetical protein [Jatrophihabitans sp.]|uniref:hypothetical protein n=1 Tax=Jatrophihabitans sp. TaxID=1932789 RepID=UPI0030C761C6|nr:hypothetical protein [Jatrophihabitans sp.]